MWIQPLLVLCSSIRLTIGALLPCVGLVSSSIDLTRAKDINYCWGSAAKPAYERKSSITSPVRWRFGPLTWGFPLFRSHDACCSAAGFERESRRHAPLFIEEKVTPHADQKAQGLESHDLSIRPWLGVFEVHKHLVGDVFLLLATGIDRHAQASGATTPSLPEKRTDQSSSVVTTPFSSNNSG